MAETRALVKFTERAYQAEYQDFRIFIQGVEVTQFVSSSVAITYANRDGPNTCSFTLDNAMDRFVLTLDNLTVTDDHPNGKWRDTQDRYSEAAKHGIYLYKTGQSEVTVDRIAELTNALFARNTELVKVRTIKEIENDPNEARRRRKMRNLERTGELSKLQRDQLRVVASDTAYDLPADVVLNNADDAKDALVEQLAARGLSTGASKKLADETVDRRRNQLVRSGRQRPAGDGPAKETNPDLTNPERSGRHKRQKLIRNPIDSDTGDSRWPLQNRSIIFHKNDPVRIFLHNPFSAADEWLYGFAGFVDQYPVQNDYLTGQSTIQVQCYDIKTLMQKMRVQQNTVFPTVAPEPLFRDRSSIFADLITPDGARLTHKFANKSFEETVALLTTGTDLNRRGQSRAFGIGDLALGKVVTYPVTKNPDDDINRATLEEWHTLVLNGPSALDDQGSIANKTLLNSRDVEFIGRNTTSDGPYAPTRAFVHFLLPKDGTAARNLTQTTFDAGGEQRDFSTRFEIVSDFCARLDYEFLVCPNGDLVFEFPMYDFMPDDFGDYGPMFEADYHLIGGNMADESGDVVTALVVTGGPKRQDIDALGNAPASVIPRGIIQSSVMASRVGVNVETHSLPFVRSGARLRSLGFIEFQKRLANASSFDMDFGFRPFITPNRPLVNVVEQRMGLTSSVTNTMQVFGVCSTGTTVRYVRQVREDGSFRFITGGASLPISYREIFPGNTKSVGNAKVGVRTSLEQDGDDTALTDQKVVENVGIAPNDDKPPRFIGEARPGTYFTLTPTTRKVVEALGQVFDDRKLRLNHIPQTDGTRFAVRVRSEDGSRLYSDAERLTLAQAAERLDYILIDTGARFRFEPRRSGQPTFIVRPESV